EKEPKKALHSVPAKLPAISACRIIHCSQNSFRLVQELASSFRTTWVITMPTEAVLRLGGGCETLPRVRGYMVSQALSRVDDNTLIREAQRGNRVAFEDLVRQYDHAVLRLALRLTGSEQDAQDIYQEAFLKAYRNLGSFRFECSFYTWIYRIVTNLCLDHLRKRQVRKEDAAVTVNQEGVEYNLLDHVADERAGFNPERDLMRRELGRKIGNALNRLTPRERMVFELKHYQGLKLRTIGE